jgi:hypothetical protein
MISSIDSKIAIRIGRIFCHQRGMPFEHAVVNGCHLFGEGVLRLDACPRQLVSV